MAPIVRPLTSLAPSCVRITDGPLIKHHFPKATVETLQEAGHWVHWDRPVEFFDLVLGLLDR